MRVRRALLDGARLRRSKLAARELCLPRAAAGTMIRGI
jgi:hypothetical protein